MNLPTTPANALQKLGYLAKALPGGVIRTFVPAVSMIAPPWPLRHRLRSLQGDPTDLHCYRLVHN